MSLDSGVEELALGRIRDGVVHHGEYPRATLFRVRPNRFRTRVVEESGESSFVRCCELSASSVPGQLESHLDVCIRRSPNCIYA